MPEVYSLPLTIFVDSSIVDVQLDSKYSSECEKFEHAFFCWITPEACYFLCNKCQCNHHGVIWWNCIGFLVFFGFSMGYWSSVAKPDLILPKSVLFSYYHRSIRFQYSILQKKNYFLNQCFASNSTLLLRNLPKSTFIWSVCSCLQTEYGSTV